jgi:hypothetical protein
LHVRRYEIHLASVLQYFMLAHNLFVLKWLFSAANKHLVR